MQDNKNTNPSTSGIADWNFDINKGIENAQSGIANNINKGNPSIADTYAPMPELVPKEKPKTSEEKGFELADNLAEKLRKNVENPTSVPATAFVGDKKRYDFMFAGESNQELEDQYGKAQGVVQKNLYGIAKAGGTLVKTAADVVGLVYDTGAFIGGLAGGDGSFFDNAFNKMNTDWKAAYDANFPIYETQAQKDTWLPTANTLPKLLNLTAFMAGMVVGTKGLGMIANAAKLGELVSLGGIGLNASYASA